MSKPVEAVQVWKGPTGLFFACVVLNHADGSAEVIKSSDNISAQEAVEFLRRWLHPPLKPVA